MISQEHLKSRLHYCPDTGVFTWLHRDDRPKEWNTKFAGKPAGCLAPSGYIMIRLGTLYRAHRLAFLYVEGEMPKQCVDHISGDRADNRWLNLRHATRRMNSMNAKRRSNNTSGHSGVTWFARDSKWRASIAIQGKLTNLGHFESMADAVKCREDACIKYGYHKNHGRVV